MYGVHGDAYLVHLLEDFEVPHEDSAYILVLGCLLTLILGEGSCAVRFVSKYCTVSRTPVANGVRREDLHLWIICHIQSPAPARWTRASWTTPTLSVELACRSICANPSNLPSVGMGIEARAWHRTSYDLIPAPKVEAGIIVRYSNAHVSVRHFLECDSCVRCYLLLLGQ